MADHTPSIYRIPTHRQQRGTWRTRGPTDPHRVAFDPDVPVASWLTMATPTARGRSEPAARRAIARLIVATAPWADTDGIDGERRLRGSERSYLWT